MKIVSLQAENIKRISAVEIKPDGNLVQITGKNGAGKTSILDSIWWALTGASHIQAVPIRKGATEARIRLDLGEMVVTRTFKDKRPSTIRVERSDGFRAAQPQDMLNSLLGALAFDPLAFTRMKPREQFDELRALIPGVDFETEDADQEADIKRRTEVNRDQKRAEGSASMVEVPDWIITDGVLAEPADEAALTQELAGAGSHNAQIERRIERRAMAQKQIDDAPALIDTVTKESLEATRKIVENANRVLNGITEQIERLRTQAADVQEKQLLDTNAIEDHRTESIRAIREQITALQNALDTAEPIPSPIDVADLTERIANARKINAGLRALAERKRHQAEADRLKNESQKLTDRLAARLKAREDAVAKAQLPVPGLGLGDGIVTLNDLPFDQASDAEQLRTSIAIAMAGNPKLRVLRVRDGSLLDEGALKLVAEMADERDYQVWIERVDSTGAVGFVIEDGRLAGTKAPDEPAQGALV